MKPPPETLLCVNFWMNLKEPTLVILPPSRRAWSSFVIAKIIARRFPNPSANHFMNCVMSEKLNTRILYFFVKGRRIIAVHGIRNKDWKIPSRDRHTALARMNDWLIRNSHEKN